MAREAARLIQCTNNMKQLALGMHYYEDTWGALPAGWRWEWLTGRWEGYFSTGHGIFQGLMPFVERQQVFNSINFHINIFYNANLTVHAIATSTLWCPSDATVQSSQILPPGSLFEDPVPPQQARMFYTSYAGNCGPWTNNTFGAGANGS